MKMVTDFHSEDTIKTGLSHGLVLELTQKIVELLWIPKMIL
jgi:hypothetical protein